MINEDSIRSSPTSVLSVVARLLEQEGIKPDRIDLVLPPQRSGSFVERLSAHLDLGRAHHVDLETDRDLLTTSFAYGMQSVLENDLGQEGDVALIIDVGSGIQVGCALYYF